MTGKRHLPPGYTIEPHTWSPSEYNFNDELVEVCLYWSRVVGRRNHVKHEKLHVGFSGSALVESIPSVREKTRQELIDFAWKHHTGVTTGVVS